MTIADFWDGTPFKLAQKGKAVYTYTRPMNLWPQRKDGLFNRAVIHSTTPRRAGRWSGQEYYISKWLPLGTIAFPVN